MEYLYVIAALTVGLLLVAVGVATAAVYTPYAYSLVDTTITALTGASLQVGNLLVVSAITAISFDVLAAAADVNVPFLIPAALGYAIFHLTMYRSSLAVTALQGTPFDPNAPLPDRHRRVLSAIAPGGPTDAD